MKQIILGNGPAGVVAAETLRRAAPHDDILLVGNEDAPPYSRMAIPYLLEGNIDESGTYLRKTDGHFDKLHIRQLCARAVAVNAEKKTVLFDDGLFEDFDRLLIATGSHPGAAADSRHRPARRSIPAGRSTDARAIATLARPGARVLQLGAGFIGCIIMEVAWSNAACS
jgi:NADPH-dependent 2,4-dienoyl-CoA reductase/sulfur reductase-like enzyme